MVITCVGIDIHGNSCIGVTHQILQAFQVHTGVGHIGAESVPEHMGCDLRQRLIGMQLSDVVKNDSQKRIALTQEQTDIFMTFIKEDKHFSCYYDEFVVLLETGMRVSELCGLTKQQLDFEKRRIWVDH